MPVICPMEGVARSLRPCRNRPMASGGSSLAVVAAGSRPSAWEGAAQVPRRDVTARKAPKHVGARSARLAPDRGPDATTSSPRSQDRTMHRNRGIKRRVARSRLITWALVVPSGPWQDRARARFGTGVGMLIPHHRQAARSRPGRAATAAAPHDPPSIGRARGATAPKAGTLQGAPGQRRGIGQLACR